MYKICTLALAVSLMPLVQDTPGSSFSVNPVTETPAFVFPYKNTIATNPFEPEKKSAASWSQNWMETASENIRKTEYRFTWEEKHKAYCTPNRKNNLRFFYDESGFSVEPRTTKIPVGDFDPKVMPADIKYRTIPNWKVKFDIDRKLLGKGLWKVSENKAECVTDNITVQYINSDEGMRQNFIVQQPLSKSGDLKINLSIKTKLKIILNNDRLEFLHKKKLVLNYKDLKVWDAAGRTLTAHFKKSSSSKYCIKVDAKNAVYPITVDPISTTPAALLESNQVNAALGFSVASAGDVNGDGYSDVIAGVPGYDDPEINEGAAFIFHGSATGISVTPATVLEANQANANFGTSVSGAGDVNGDGYSDVIVGANLYDNGATDEGAAFIYHGSATGINTIAATMVESNQALSQLGFSVAGAGDVNGDGYSDVIAGAWLYSNDEGAEGRAFIYHGSATGINSAAVTTVESNQVNANLGVSVAGAGDVNGDGFSDIIVGAQLFDNGTTDEGAAFIYHGSVAGINSIAATMVESNQAFCQFGFSVAGAGDVNGDGYSDVIVGAYTFDDIETNEGAAFIYYGSATGINNIAAATLESNQVGASLGVAVACAGDINGDGFSDLIVGATQYDNVETNEGAAYIYFGSAAGINLTATTILESNQANAQMGRGVASAGDVNGDGYSDVIVGASQYDNVEINEGAAFVYHGSATGINITATTMTESGQVNANLGYAVSGAGDINGDGYSDVIVGAPYFDNGQTDEGVVFIYHGSANGINPTSAAMLESNQAASGFGFSVSEAGDVNGDGYSDVIIGAPYFDNPQTDEGRAFIYHGSAAGINVVAAATVESNQSNANLGFSVSAAGDVNGDGYADVVVGAYRYDNGQLDEGAAFVYRGSATGINTVAASVLESNQANAYLGYSVAGAGDVNGDGFSDIIAGAPLFDNGQTEEGAAFVYHGSLAGVSTAFAAMVESNQVNAFLGYAVAGAGDVNADGYADVIVGAPFFDNGESDEGAAFVYHGGGAGINVVAVSMMESNQVNANLGAAVANTGDSNGDGYSDIVVGVPLFDNGQSNEGAVFVYYGSTTGIVTSNAIIIEANQDIANLGFAVDGAGDVNGDGYSDLIAGAYGYDNGQMNEGAAFVYQGNSPGNGSRNNLRIYNVDLTTPLSSNNFIFGNFGAGLYARSFLGRAKGKLVWETRLNYNAYSGIPITNSTFFTSQQVAYTDMGITGIELKSLVTKLLGGRYSKLRARIKYDPVSAITGQVYSPWRNVSSIIDANKLGILPIELISFKASWLQKGKTAKLDLTTDKESGVCCFDFEKSADGFNFYSIGSLPAKNIRGKQSYSFIDGNATGTNQFYRVKIKGMAGQLDYSNIQQLQNDGSTEILVFPNPTTDVLQLQLNKPYDKMILQIFNSAGQAVKQMTIPASNQTITIPVQNLAAGKYWLFLQTGAQKQALQFIKE